jgi:hypothetical protein
MGGVYKFLHSRDIDRLLIDGTVRVSSLSYFKRLEGAQWIADKLEGGVQIPIGRAIAFGVGGNAEKQLRDTAPAGHRLPIEGSGGAMFTVSGITFEFSHPEVYIFCASIGELNTLRPNMTGPESADYNACVRIMHFDQLAHRILYPGWIIAPYRARANAVFGGVRFERVSYVNVIREPGSPKLPQPSPFVKHSTFSAQSEIRIVLYPLTNAPVAEANLIIQVPGHRRFFRQERLGG